MISTRYDRLALRLVRILVADLVLILGAIIGVNVAIAAAPASASAPHTQTVTSLSCSETWNGFPTPSNNDAYVVWTANSCSHQLRVKLRCVNPPRGLVAFAYGGWVIPVGLHSAATCPGAEPVMTNAYAQYRDASGDPVTTVQFYP